MQYWIDKSNIIYYFIGPILIIFGIFIRLINKLAEKLEERRERKEKEKEDKNE